MRAKRRDSAARRQERVRVPSQMARRGSSRTTGGGSEKEGLLQSEANFEKPIEGRHSYRISEDRRNKRFGPRKLSKHEIGAALRRRTHSYYYLVGKTLVQGKKTSSNHKRKRKGSHKQHCSLPGTPRNTQPIFLLRQQPRAPPPFAPQRQVPLLVHRQTSRALSPL